MQRGFLIFLPSRLVPRLVCPQDLRNISLIAQISAFEALPNPFHLPQHLLQDLFDHGGLCGWRPACRGSALPAAGQHRAGQKGRLAPPLPVEKREGRRGMEFPQLTETEQDKQNGNACLPIGAVAVDRQAQ